MPCDCDTLLYPALDPLNQVYIFDDSAQRTGVLQALPGTADPATKVALPVGGLNFLTGQSDFYKCWKLTVYLLGDPANPQNPTVISERMICEYDSTGVATIDAPWDIIPAAGLPFSVTPPVTRCPLAAAPPNDGLPEPEDCIDLPIKFQTGLQTDPILITAANATSLTLANTTAGNLSSQTTIDFSFVNGFFHCWRVVVLQTGADPLSGQVSGGTRTTCHHTGAFGVGATITINLPWETPSALVGRYAVFVPPDVPPTNLNLTQHELDCPQDGSHGFAHSFHLSGLRTGPNSTIPKFYATAATDKTITLPGSVDLTGISTLLCWRLDVIQGDSGGDKLLIVAFDPATLIVSVSPSFSTMPNIDPTSAKRSLFALTFVCLDTCRTFGPFLPDSVTAGSMVLPANYTRLIEVNLTPSELQEQALTTFGMSETQLSAENLDDSLLGSSIASAELDTWGVTSDQEPIIIKTAEQDILDSTGVKKKVTIGQFTDADFPGDLPLNAADQAAANLLIAQLAANLGLTISQYVALQNAQIGRTAAAPPWDSAIISSSSVQAVNDGAASIDDFYKDWWIAVIAGTGFGQTAQATGYNGTTRRLRFGSLGLDKTSRIVLSSCSVAGPDKFADPAALTLPSSYSDKDHFYDCARIRLVAGTGEGHDSRINEYVGLTKALTLAASFIPDSTSVWLILQPCVSIKGGCPHQLDIVPYPAINSISAGSSFMVSTNDSLPRPTTSGGNGVLTVAWLAADTSQGLITPEGEAPSSTTSYWFPGGSLIDMAGVDDAEYALYYRCRLSPVGAPINFVGPPGVPDDAIHWGVIGSTWNFDYGQGQPCTDCPSVSTLNIVFPCVPPTDPPITANALNPAPNVSPYTLSVSIAPTQVPALLVCGIYYAGPTVPDSVSGGWSVIGPFGGGGGATGTIDLYWQIVTDPGTYTMSITWHKDTVAAGLMLQAFYGT